MQHTPPTTPINRYIEARPLLLHLRVMDRFFDEVVDHEPYREHYAALMVAFADILNEELAPFAFALAVAVQQLEEACPEVRKRSE